jgi:uncharacterized membrane protein YgcG
MSVAALTVLSAVAVFAALGGIGLANGVISVAQYQYGHDKVTICHKGKTLTISTKAWPAHQRHGDTQGACATEKKHEDHGKHKGAAHHAPNHGGGTTTTTTTTTTTATTTTTETGHGHDDGGGDNGNGHGNGNSGGNGNGKGHGHDK